MKNVLILTACFLCFNGLMAQTSVLKGNVKKVEATRVYAQGNDMNTSEEWFYSDGDFQKLDSYVKKSFGTSFTYKYKYNESGKLLSATMDRNGQPAGMEIHGFNSTEMLDSVFSLQNGTKQLLSIDRYAEDMDLLESHAYQKNGTLGSSTYYIYGASGKLSAMVSYSFAGSGAVQSRTVAYYDKNERLVSRMQYSPDEVLLWKESYKYDKHGNPTKRNQDFFQDGNCTKRVVEAREYEYDSKGNWIVMRYINNGKLYYTTNRKIEYR